MTKKREFSIVVELTEPQLKGLSDRMGLDHSATAQDIAAVAQASLVDQADGGILIDASATRQIIDITGPIADVQEIVKYIETAHSMEDGAVALKWRIDPVFLPYYQSVADSNGITLETYLQNVMQYAQMQGWFGSIVPDAETLFMSRSDLNRVRAVLGKEYVTGTDIAQWIEKMGETPELEDAPALR